MTAPEGYLPPDKEGIPMYRRCTGCQKPLTELEVPREGKMFRKTEVCYLCERCDRAPQGDNVLLYDL